MRVCLVCEGCYPYIQGGVSSWIQMLCSQFKDIEFVIWSIATTREDMSEYKYQIPDNVKEIRTLYLGDQKWTGKHKNIHLKKAERDTLRSLLLDEPQTINWNAILEFMKKYRTRLKDILMSEDFFDICLQEYQQQNSKKVFNDFLWNLRGMYFPFMSILADDFVEADIYHAVATGYAGIIGSCASYLYNKPYILSEHGIYTREREEDIIRSNWVDSDYKNNWIDFFKKLSFISYNQATVVTSLFHVNKTLQMELGCPEEKIRIIPNGVAVNDFVKLPNLHKLPADKFHIGTVLRVVPIKDVKTMLLAFDIVRTKFPQVQLNIMGNFDEDPEYYEECKLLIEELEIKDVIFLGQVNIKEYFPEMKFLILSSISEGQPLAILEGFAAGLPFVATNVGHCKGLIEGEDGDTFGKAGIVVPVMQSESIAEALIYCIEHPKELKSMGIAGRKRVKKYYQREMFIEKYRELYRELGAK